MEVWIKELQDIKDEINSFVWDELQHPIENLQLLLTTVVKIIDCFIMDRIKLNDWRKQCNEHHAKIEELEKQMASVSDFMNSYGRKL